MDQLLLEELLTKNESEKLDFKATLYRREHYEALLKDILGMANANVLGSRYIIMGVKQYITGESDIIGLLGEAIDSSTFQQLVFENIEPSLHIELHYLKFQEKQLAVLEIVTPEEQPYMLKKQYGKLHKGTCYVRKGATNGYALRSDFDRLYKKQPFEIRILHPMLRAVDPDCGCASLECSFRNLTEFPVTIYRGFLEVNGHEGMRSRHFLSGYERDIPGADYRLYLAPKTEITGDFQFDFTSSDCLRIGLNTDGYIEEALQFTLTLVDTTHTEYSITIDDCRVFAKGDYLWKVRRCAK